MDLLTLEHFSNCVGETFAAQLQGMEASFVLVEAQPLGQQAKGAARAGFSLLFLNPSPILLPQQIYPMRHPQLGELGIFLVPIAQNRDGFVYQAVFN